jgi:hypothetical protein
MKVHTLDIDSSQRDTSVYPDSNNYVVTLENPIYDVEEIRLVSARIPTPQTPSPNSLVLRLSSGSDEFNQSVYVGNPHYTGHILLNGTSVINFHGADDPFVYHFHSGPQKVITELGLGFFYMNSGVLTQYDFDNEEHILKFEVKCSTDKLEGLPKIPLDVVEKELPPPISIPEIVEDVYEWKIEYISIGIIIFIGIVILSLMKRKPKLTGNRIDGLSRFGNTG